MNVKTIETYQKQRPNNTPERLKELKELKVITHLLEFREKSNKYKLQVEVLRNGKILQTQINLSNQDVRVLNLDFFDFKYFKFQSHILVENKDFKNIYKSDYTKIEEFSSHSKENLITNNDTDWTIKGNKNLGYLTEGIKENHVRSSKNKEKHFYSLDRFSFNDLFENDETEEFKRSFIDNLNSSNYVERFF